MSIRKSNWSNFVIAMAMSFLCKWKGHALRSGFNYTISIYKIHLSAYRGNFKLDNKVTVALGQIFARKTKVESFHLNFDYSKFKSH